MTRWLASLLYGLSANVPLSYAAMALLLIFVIPLANRIIDFRVYVDGLTF
jgi:hypothetical protein